MMNIESFEMVDLICNCISNVACTATETVGNEVTGNTRLIKLPVNIS